MKKKVKNSISRKVEKQVDKAVEKEVGEVQKDLKKSVSAQVEKAVEKGLDEAEKDIKKEVKKEVLSGLRHKLDVVAQFRALRAHHKFLFAVIVGIGVVAFWRGVWLMIDLALFPDDPWFRAVLSTLIGMTILAASGVFLRALANAQD